MEQTRMNEEVKSDSGTATVEPFSIAEADWLIQHFLNLANSPSTGIEVGITLNVGGLLVSGTMVSGKKYFEGIADLLSNANTNMPEIAESWKSLSAFGQIYDDTAEVESNRNPQYIHLRNTRFFSAAGTAVPNSPGVWWRGRITEVAGFSFGTMSQE
jgi:hypothetical protein